MTGAELVQLDVILNDHDNEWDMYNWLVGREVRTKCPIFFTASQARIPSQTAGARLPQRPPSLPGFAELYPQPRQGAQNTDAGIVGGVRSVFRWHLRAIEYFAD